MPMIDVYATAGTFTHKHQLAADLATAVMTIEQVPDIPMFRQCQAGRSPASSWSMERGRAVPAGTRSSACSSTTGTRSTCLIDRDRGRRARDETV
jgi:hypothetical protein